MSKPIDIPYTGGAISFDRRDEGATWIYVYKGDQGTLSADVPLDVDPGDQRTVELCHINDRDPQFITLDKPDHTQLRLGCWQHTNLLVGDSDAEYILSLPVKSRVDDTPPPEALPGDPPPLRVTLRVKRRLPRPI